MAKLFIFGIGGTGSRVIKSLISLLAAGVSTGNNVDEIIPIIIDVDKGNEDLTRTIEMLSNYKIIHQTIAENRAKYEGFFKTKVTDLYPINGKEFRLTIEDVQGKKFGEYIDYTTLTGYNNKSFAELLFSGYQANNGALIPLLNLDMKEGFQGNPKLGSVVLNQFKRNVDFDKFANNFQAGDRIFIISSIHGGTGAAGFPLLLKNLRNAQLPTPNSALLKNSLIGASTILPYFKLKQGDIKSEDFISKSKAALEYYINNVNPSLNSLYYIGLDSNTNNYDNNKGGVKQKNPAHFVELAAAMSVIDFTRQSDANIQQQGSRFMEYGVNNFGNTIDFSVLGPATNTMIQKPLTQYMLFKLYLDLQILDSINKQPWSNRGKVKIKKEFINPNSGFYQTLDSFNNRFSEWLKELAENQPSFLPFDLAVSKKSLLKIISTADQPKAKSWKTNFALFDECLNTAEREIGNLPLEQKFVELFNRATSHLITK